MKFSIENDDKIIVFTIKENSVGADNAPDLKAKILIEAQPDIQGMVFEIGKVQSIDSSGLGAFLLAHRQLREYNVPVHIVNANKFVRSLMSMTKIDQLFTFTDDVETAKANILNNPKNN